MLYRALISLAYGKATIEKGAIHTLTKIKPENIATLLRRGRIAIYQAPPLAQLSDRWKRRERTLRKFEIGTIEMLDMPLVELAEKLGKPEALLKRWRCELLDVLGIKEPATRRG